MGTVGSSSPDSAEDARKHLIESHLALVHAVARRYAGRGEALDDLVQVGAIGLIKASDRFDPSRGVTFATYATPSIEGAIRHHLRDRVSTLRIPRELQQKSGELHQRSGELAAALGRSPTTRELATSLDAEERDVERVLSADRARESLPISPGDDGLEVADESNSLAGSDDRLLLAGSLLALDERERRVVLLRFHADMTEREIARELGISQAQVSRLLGGALATLREELTSSSDSVAEGDITKTAVIPPVTARKRTRRELRKGGASGRKRARRETRIGGVGATQESRKLEHYLELPYRVAVQSELDGSRQGWRATVVELAGCSAQGSTPDEAVRRLRAAMEAWLTDALVGQREIPLPGSKPVRDEVPVGELAAGESSSGESAKSKAAASHSGRFLVRMPSELHEQLARAAESEEVSLNRFVTNALAASVSSTPPIEEPLEAPAVVSTFEPPPDSQRQPARSLRLALAANLVVVVVAGVVAVVLLVLALKHGI